MMYDLEPFYRDDDDESGTEPPHGALHYRAGGGGWWLGDVDLREVLTRADGHSAPILVASRGQVREVTVQWTCDTCGCPLEEAHVFPQDDVGDCPRCRSSWLRTTKRLRARRQRDLLLLETEIEIGQIVEASEQG